MQNEGGSGSATINRADNAVAKFCGIDEWRQEVSERIGDEAYFHGVGAHGNLQCTRVRAKRLAHEGDGISDMKLGAAAPVGLSMATPTAMRCVQFNITPKHANEALLGVGI